MGAPEESQNPGEKVTQPEWRGLNIPIEISVIDDDEEDEIGMVSKDSLDDGPPPDDDESEDDIGSIGPDYSETSSIAG